MRHSLHVFFPEGVFLRTLVKPVLILFLLCSTVAAAQTPHKTTHIIFVMIDGLRWQEVFQGAEADLMNKKNGKVSDEVVLKKIYWRDTSEARRQALLPFVWGVMAQQGQIFGNREKGSDAYVTNGKFFSYPGYSESLCGFADKRINSNEKIPNPNVTVLEWLNQQPAFRGRVAAFGGWDVFPSIFNASRAGFLVNAGWDTFPSNNPSPELALINKLKDETPRVWSDEPFDALPFYTALEYLKSDKPGVLFIGLGETDDWAHAGQYTEYLDSARRVDAYLRILWETVQLLPEYRDSTTLIFSPDHGRGADKKKWKDHGEEIPGSKYIWMAFLGPDTKSLGERKNTAPVTQSQIAATLAALLGQDYASAAPKAAKPIVDVLP
jgi:hypothetical protein